MSQPVNPNLNHRAQAHGSHSNEPAPNPAALSSAGHDVTTQAASGMQANGDILDRLEIRMPDLGPDIPTARLSKWCVSVADTIEPGDILAEIVADRMTMEIEAEAAGRVAELLIDAGQTELRPGTPVAVLEVAPNGDETAQAGSQRMDPAPQVPGKPDPARAAAEPASPATGGPATAARHRSSAKPQSRQSPATQPAAQPAAQPARPKATQSDGRPSAAAVKNLTVRAALREGLIEELSRDDRVVVIGEDAIEEDSTYKVNYSLHARFGDKRIRNVPVTPQAFTGLAIGAAMAGLRPVVSYQHFSLALQAIDQIINTAAKLRYVTDGKLKLPIVFRGPHGAGDQVGAQQAQCFSALFAHIPGLIVLAPSNAADAKGLIKAAIRCDDPVVILESERLYGRASAVETASSEQLTPIGEASRLRPGDDVTLVGYGRTTAVCMEAAKQLSSGGIEADVIDLRTLSPIDLDALAASLRRTHRIVIVEDAWPAASLGATIASRLTVRCFDDLDAPPATVNGVAVPMPYAANLERLALPSAGDVVSAVHKVCYK